MNRFPYRSNDRLGSQQPSPSGSPAPTAISFVAHVLPPSKLTPSNIPAVSPASPWPTLVTVTMLRGLVGLTAIVSSDSFRCRWLISTLAGVTGPAPATARAVGVAASAAAISTATTTIENRKRYMAGLLPARCHHEGYAGRHRRERAQHARTKSASRAGSCLHAASRPQLAAGSRAWLTWLLASSGPIISAASRACMARRATAPSMKQAKIAGDPDVSDLNRIICVRRPARAAKLSAAQIRQGAVVGQRTAHP